MTLQYGALSSLERQCSERVLGRDRFFERGPVQGYDRELAAATGARSSARTRRSRFISPFDHSCGRNRPSEWRHFRLAPVLRGRGRDIWEMVFLDEASSSRYGSMVRFIDLPRGMRKAVALQF
jgi:hypothetical protein